MGDPKKHRRKYERPRHPWKEERITQETEIAHKYGLANRREIWKTKSMTERFRKGARDLMGSTEEEAEKRRNELVNRLNKIGLITTNNLEDIFRLTTEDLLERRLQTIVYRKGLANTMKQARQFVVHGHVTVQDKVVDVPSYIVEKKEEDTIKIRGELKIEKPSTKKKKKDEEIEEKKIEKPHAKKKKTEEKESKPEKKTKEKKEDKKEEKAEPAKSPEGAEEEKEEVKEEKKDG